MKSEILALSIFGKEDCTFCEQAKKLAEDKGIEFEYKELDVDYTMQELVQKLRDKNAMPKRLTVPQIFDQDGNHIGGYTDLESKLI